jgi:hypothetical protein
MDAKRGNSGMEIEYLPECKLLLYELKPANKKPSQKIYII